MEFLCIGGPLDGKYREGNHPQSFTFCDRPSSVLSTEPVERLRRASSAEVSYSTYLRCGFRVGASEVTFWAIAGLSPTDVLHMLAAAYVLQANKGEE